MVDSKAHENLKTLADFKVDEFKKYTDRMMRQLHGTDCVWCQAPQDIDNRTGDGNDGIGNEDGPQDESAVEIGETEFEDVEVEVEDANPLPEYATFDFDSRKWWALLDSYQVDETARANLFLLAQYGDRGKYEALDLIVKLMNKGYKNELNNPSRGLHSSCSKLHAKLSKEVGSWVDIEDPADAYGGGQGTDNRWDDSRGGWVWIESEWDDSESKWSRSHDDSAGSSDARPWKRSRK